jgi:hypothetical protein
MGNSLKTDDKSYFELLPKELNYYFLDIIHQDVKYDLYDLMDIFGYIMNLNPDEYKKYADYRYKFTAEYPTRFTYYNHEFDWCTYIKEVDGVSKTDIFDIVYSKHIFKIPMTMILLLYKYERTPNQRYKNRVIKFIQKLSNSTKFVSIFGARSYREHRYLSEIIMTDMLRILSNHYFILIPEE